MSVFYGVQILLYGDSCMKNYKILFQHKVRLKPDMQSGINLATVSVDNSAKFY